MANTGNITVTETDMNPLSPTYDTTRTRTYQDLTRCPTNNFKLRYTTSSGSGEIPCNESTTLASTETSSTKSTYVTAEIGRCVEVIRGSFYEAYYLTSVTIPDTVTTMGYHAFAYCDLTSVEIPHSVTSIGDYDFNGNSNMSSMTVDSNNPVYDSRNNCNAIIETASNTLVSGCKTTVIPNTVTAIGNGAFYSNLSARTNGPTTVNIPSSVVSIGSSAFYTCTSLTTMNIPDSVTSIDTFAFYNCTNLRTITFGTGLTSIKFNSLRICESLQSITFKSVVPPTIPGSSFSYDVFERTNNCPIYVPAESVQAYKTARNWTQLASRIQAIPS